MLLVKDVLLPTGEKSNVLVSDGKIAGIGVNPDELIGKSCVEVMEAEGLAILPAFYNTHNHAPMTLLRGYGDDRPLMEWLTKYVWPYEDTLNGEDIRRGSRIAIHEMTSSGSVFFNDMYFYIDETIEEVAKSGMRAAIGITVMDNHSKTQTESKRDFVRHFQDPTGGRISLVMAPHSVYCVGKENLLSSAAFARENGVKLHIHLSETISEVQNCIKATGLSPVRYLDSIGFLGPDVIAAHCVHVDKEEWDILAERGVTVAHCPCSNMKLGSGRFPYELAIASGARITIGTDGCSSNNNLDMREEMKIASLLAKCVSVNDGVFTNEGNSALLPAKEVLRWATVNGAEAFGINGGEIAVGKVADFILVDLSSDRFQPLHNLISDWVYAANSAAIRYTFCEGKRIY